MQRLALISLIILNNLDFTKKNIESKILAKKLYIVLTTLEPISVILIFIGLVIIASENFKKRQSYKKRLEKKGTKGIQKTKI